MVVDEEVSVVVGLEALAGDVEGALEVVVVVLGIVEEAVVEVDISNMIKKMILCKNTNTFVRMWPLNYTDTNHSIESS